MRTQAWVIVAAAWMSLCVAPVGAVEPGVRGRVTLSPAQPGPQRRGELEAAALAGVAVLLRDSHGRIAARAITDAQGHFSLAAPAGPYRLSVDLGTAMLPRCEAVDLTIGAGRMTEIHLACDSGMR